MADPVRDFLADDTGDLAVVNGDFAFVAGEQAVQQGIDCRVKSWLLEILLDQTQGVPWAQDILVKSPDPNVVKEDIREAIADTPDVLTVVATSFELDADRNATIDYSVTDAYTTDGIDGTVTVGTT